MKTRPPADRQPDLWSLLADMLADAEPEKETEKQPEAPPPARDWEAAALAYLGKLGRQAAPPARFTVAAWRYLNGPLVVGSRSWGDTTPAWLRDAVRVARLALILAGETEQASEEEAVAYLMAASLQAPMSHAWAELYFWLCARVLPRWGKVPEAEFWAMLGERHDQRRELAGGQRDDLRRLLGDIRRSVEKHAAR
jgi:hypothetical protein